MQRIRIQRKAARPRRRLNEALPLDPRDPDIVKAKQGAAVRLAPPR